MIATTAAGSVLPFGTAPAAAPTGTAPDSGAAELFAGHVSRQAAAQSAGGSGHAPNAAPVPGKADPADPSGPAVWTEPRNDVPPALQNPENGRMLPIIAQNLLLRVDLSHMQRLAGPGPNTGIQPLIGNPAVPGQDAGGNTDGLPETLVLGPDTATPPVQDLAIHAAPAGLPEVPAGSTITGALAPNHIPAPTVAHPTPEGTAAPPALPVPEGMARAEDAGRGKRSSALAGPAEPPSAGAVNATGPSGGANLAAGPVAGTQPGGVVSAGPMPADAVQAVALPGHAMGSSLMAPGSSVAQAPELDAATVPAVAADPAGNAAARGAVDAVQLATGSITEAAPAAKPAAEVAARPAAPPPLLRQLAVPLATVLTAPNGLHTLTVQVAPDSLGPVVLTANWGAEGMKLDLAAPSDAGREALRALLPELRRDFAMLGHGSVQVLAAAPEPAAAGSSPNSPSSGQQGLPAGGQGQPGQPGRDGSAPEPGPQPALPAAGEVTGKPEQSMAPLAPGTPNDPATRHLAASALDLLA
ncbi:hypothetical protein [Glutamicibacter nicotianae]|uniref:hypothetical protein n=1 Tax=Glutamicibacter nicotianae TaxID=37929 RepID=UPI003C2B2ECF